MNLQIVTIRCRADNYAFLIFDPESSRAVLVDVPEAGPINAALAEGELELTHVLLTHHHDDHVEGLIGLSGAPQVIGAAADAHRLPPLDTAVAPGDTLTLLDVPFAVMAADGHTVGHIAYHAPTLSALFSGDSLMTHGCGRLFEGTPAQMMEAITTFAALPDDTRVFSGHDYARANLAFAATCAPDLAALNARRDDIDDATRAGRSTTGVTLALEKRLNPYLRCHLAEVKAAVDMAGAADLDVFAEIRRRKDVF